MSCDYCYEKSNRDKLDKPQVATKHKIDSFLMDIVNRESDQSQHVVVIFGGEPFLKYDLIKYLINKGLELGNFCYSLTTNGTVLVRKKILFDFIKYYYSIKNKVALSLELSYDASGNFRRIYSNGKSTDADILRLMRYLCIAKIPFVLRYTVTKSNYLNLETDIESLVEQFDKIYKVQFSLCWSEFESKEYITKYVNDASLRLYKKYNIPMCEQVCDLCKKCDRSSKYNFYYTVNNKIQVEKTKQGGFNHFV
jgi:sulfatase maturation enzyme AslB (radical SAM superfamily)